MAKPAYRITEQDHLFARPWVHANREDSTFLWSQGKEGEGN